MERCSYLLRIFCADQGHSLAVPKQISSGSVSCSFMAVEIKKVYFVIHTVHVHCISYNLSLSDYFLNNYVV